MQRLQQILALVAIAAALIGPALLPPVFLQVLGYGAAGAVIGLACWLVMDRIWDEHLRL